MESSRVVPLAARPHRTGRARAAHLGPERRRPLILDAALEVYVERGYRGTSMQAVADAAGVTKPVVYECYPNKDELLLALLDREERRLLDAITDALPRNPAFDNVEVVLAAGLTAFLTGAGQATNSWRVVFESRRGSDSVVAARVRRARDMILGQIRELVRLYMTSAEIDDVERKSPVVAELLATVAESCVRMLVLEHYPWTAVELATYVSRLITRGVRPV
ncbi:MAG: TetR/AcrR family transcriptional regulator [Pseudonocardiales bacterium]|nr:TetR/AcrR family transcriptional regulator [Pseudonocardiales bacterium]